MTLFKKVAAMVLTQALIDERNTFELVVLDDIEYFVHGLNAVYHSHEFLLCFVDLVSAHFVDETEDLGTVGLHQLFFSQG